MISASGVSKRFGPRLALQNIDVQVKAGQLVALVGPNGAGKSTLLRILATLAKPSAGRVELAGFRLPAQAVEARAILGFLGHQPILYPELSAEQNLLFAARLRQVKNPTRRVIELLKSFDLDLRRHEPVRSFSRGMQQRVALAGALLARPKVLLLDEPHSGLDADSVAILDEQLRRLLKWGTAILMATHDLRRAKGLASRVDILAGGRLTASLTPKQLGAGPWEKTYERVLRSAGGEA